jgi:hypothetical protein
MKLMCQNIANRSVVNIKNWRLILWIVLKKSCLRIENSLLHDIDVPLSSFNESAELTFKYQAVFKPTGT